MLNAEPGAISGATKTERQKRNSSPRLKSRSIIDTPVKFPGSKLERIFLVRPRLN